MFSGISGNCLVRPNLKLTKNGAAATRVRKLSRMMISGELFARWTTLGATPLAMTSPYDLLVDQPQSPQWRGHEAVFEQARIEFRDRADPALNRQRRAALAVAARRAHFPFAFIRNGAVDRNDDPVELNQIGRAHV